MKKYFLFITILLLSFNLTDSQDIDLEVSKGFLIILSTKDYDSALKTAEDASEKLDIKIDLRGYYADSTKGLKTDQECGCGSVHGYSPRGRYDDGKYISIEYSDKFDGFAEGYYIVVVASGQIDKIEPILSDVQEHYKDAYIKNTKVYIGCMH